MRRNNYTRLLMIIVVAIFVFAFLGLTGKIGFIGIIIVLVVLGVIMLWSLVVQIKKSFSQPRGRFWAKNTYLKLAATFMGLLLVAGTGLYFYVFYAISQKDIVDFVPKDGGVYQLETQHVEFNNIEYFFRSLICSLDLFMFDVDSNIIDRLDDEPGTKAWVYIHAVLSYFCTVALIVGLVYSRLRAYYKLNYRTKIDNNHNHLYLFFGVNEPSETLIKYILNIVKDPNTLDKDGDLSAANEDGDPNALNKTSDPNAVIVLIDRANVNEEDTDNFDEIVRFVTHKHKTFDIADNYSIRVAIAGKQLCEIDEEISSMSDFDAFGYLGISQVAKLIKKLERVNNPQLHIFFLDDNEEQNILNVINLSKDMTILSMADKNIHPQIYCHARHNGPNRVIEDIAVMKDLEIKIIDSSHLAVEWLKLNSDLHPYNVAEMDPDNPVTVKGSFDALIIGFGEVGRDAFRFLYEFAAFVDNDATLEQARRSQFNCTIVDKDIDIIKGTIMANMPGVFKQDNVKFKALDFNHEAFYEDVLNEKNITKLNYVVISIGNNDEAIALATRIFSRFRQYGGDLSKLMILVRCTDDAKYEAVKRIADHYNFGYGDGVNNRPVIRIFGQPESIYSYRLVVSDELNEKGVRFYESYCKIREESMTWKKRRDKFAPHGKVPNLDDLRKLRRQESQDMANALHVYTKLAFFKAAMPNMNWSEFLARYFINIDTPNRVGQKSEITYPGLSARENLIILRLAQMEHLRWNAAHELLGYVRREDGKTGCDEQTMRHNCLTDWNMLDAESDKTKEGKDSCDYKAFDFATVDTTMAWYDSTIKKHK